MFERKCPNCGKKLTYKTKQNLNQAEIKNSNCGSCTQKLINSGKNNPMYGTSFYDIWVEKYGEEIAKQKLKEYSNRRKGKKLNLSKEAKLKRCHTGIKNGMYGKSFYDIWIEKYGEEIAKQKLEEKNKKMAEKMSGENNPMYGKPSPEGSGNGWSGWYNGLYFRSLMELSFIKLMNEKNIRIESGENKKHSIMYYDSFSKVQRNFFPDFYLSEFNIYCEIKPLNLLRSINNKLKKLYSKKNFLFLTEKDFKQISSKDLKEMYLTKEIIFIEKYDKKMKERYL